MGLIVEPWEPRQTSVDKNDDYRTAIVSRTKRLTNAGEGATWTVGEPKSIHLQSNCEFSNFIFGSKIFRTVLDAPLAWTSDIL